MGKFCRGTMNFQTAEILSEEYFPSWTKGFLQRTLFTKKYSNCTINLHLGVCAVFVRAYYSRMFSMFELDHKYDTRDNSSKRLKPPQTISATIQSGVVTQMLKIYNHLPEEYRSMPIGKFKAILKKHLVANVFYNVKDYFECNSFV